MSDAEQAADREAILALYDDEDRELVELIIRSKERTVNRVGESRVPAHRDRLLPRPRRRG
jgi:hypothetical protein